MNYFITGDKHGYFKDIKNFCEEHLTSKEDVLIILGDAGINYFGDYRDTEVKEFVQNLPITIFAIHGNHEMRPFIIPTYKEMEWNESVVYVEEKFPNILFAKDGEIYNINNQKVIVIGGAYSVDKWYRLQMGYRWFEDEQPNEEIKNYVESKLEKNDWNVDIVLSHTTPYHYMPTDMFLSGIDQSTVDNSTEYWLQAIEEELSYKKWYCGHFHTDRAIDNIYLMYREIHEFC